MQNVIPKITDTGMSTSIPVPAILYKDGKYFSFVVYDVLGEIVDLIEFQREDVDHVIFENQEIEEEKIYFVDVTFYDVFFQVSKINSIKEIGQSVNTFLKEGVQTNIHFMKQLFKDCKSAHKLGLLN